jgi:hypothetical protein
MPDGSANSRTKAFDGGMGIRETPSTTRLWIAYAVAALVRGFGERFVVVPAKLDSCPIGVPRTQEF